VADTTKQTTTATEQDNVVQKGEETVVAQTGADPAEKTAADTTKTTATSTEPSKTADPPVRKLDETTKPEEKKGPEETKGAAETTKDDTKKDTSNGSVSLTFSPKKTTEGETGGAGTGQPDPTGTRSTTTADPEKAAA